MHAMKKSEALNILGLADGASEDDIKAAHRRKIRENHPDRFSDPTEKQAAEERTKLINEARDVLNSGKWDPEYGPRATTYSSPYAHPSSGVPHNGDPFEGFPFTVDYVWTSWDDIGSGQRSAANADNRQRARRGGVWGQGYANPFEGDPFFTEFTRAPRKTPQEEEREAKADLRQTLLGCAVKLAVLALCSSLGAVAIGMFVYVVATLLLAVAREVKGCTSFLVLPFIIFFGPLIAWFMPRLGAGIGAGLFVFFGIAVLVDISTIRRSVSTLHTAREKVKVSS